MAKPLSALGSIITVVVFLALIALATVLYGGGADREARVQQNFFTRNTKLVFDYLLSGLQGVTDASLNSQTENGGLATTTTGMVEAAQTGTLKKIGSDIRQEWEKDGGVQLGSASIINMDRIWEWRKTESGAEVIFKDKNGLEHKVVLPFKFLAQ